MVQRSGVQLYEDLSILELRHIHLFDSDWMPDLAWFALRLQDWMSDVKQVRSPEVAGGEEDAMHVSKQAWTSVHAM